MKNTTDLLSERKKTLIQTAKELGFSHLNDADLLELLLSYLLPKNPNHQALAEKMISHFGSLFAIFQADEDQLSPFIGDSESVLLFFRLIPDTARLYRISKRNETPILANKASAEEYLSDFFIGRNVETFYLLLLDKNKKLIQNIKMASGVSDSVIVDLKEISRKIANCKPKYVILAHNHPYGQASPSAADEEITRKIADISESFDAKLLNHYIFSPYDIFSMADSYQHKKYFLL